MENQHLELHKEQYWVLPEIHAIDRIYKAYDEIVKADDEYNARTAGIRASAAFEQAVVTNKLDHRLLKKVCSPNLWKHLEDIAEGRNKGAKVALDPF